MLSNYNHFVQKGYGNFEDDDDDIESSQESESEQSSQSSTSREEMESSQEEEEHIDPWSRIQDEASDRHEAQLEALINEYEQNGDSSEVARNKAENALLPVYRKELRMKIHCTLTLTPTVPLLYPSCTLPVPLLYPSCTPTVSLLYPSCTPTVPFLYPYCTLL